MRAITIEQFGGNEVLGVREAPDPVLGPDSVLVRVAGAGVNPVDWKIVRGFLQGAFPHHLPLVPGWDVSGTVEAVGPAVREFAVGDRVVWTLGVDGGWRHALLARHAPSRAVELDVVGVAGPDGAGRGGVLLSGDGVHAFLPDEPAPPLTDATDGRTTRSVVLFEEGHHGDVPEAVPPTSGVVTAVRLVRLAHRLDPAGRAHEPVAGSAALEDVRRAGRWQPDEVDGRTFVGFLVDLTVGP